jgi:hypothetical protein
MQSIRESTDNSQGSVSPYALLMDSFEFVSTTSEPTPEKLQARERFFHCLSALRNCDMERIQRILLLEQNREESRALMDLYHKSQQTSRLVCGHVLPQSMEKCTICDHQFLTVYGYQITNRFNSGIPISLLPSHFAESNREEDQEASSAKRELDLFKMMDYDACCPMRHPRRTEQLSVLDRDTGLATLEATWAEDIQLFCSTQKNESVHALGERIQAKLLLFSHLKGTISRTRQVFRFKNGSETLTETNVPHIMTEILSHVRSLETGGAIIVPVMAEDHLMVLEIRKSGEANFSLTLFNTSPAYPHEPAVKESRSRHSYLYPMEFKQVSQEQLSDVVTKIVEYNMGKIVYRDGKLQTSGLDSYKFYEALLGKEAPPRFYPITESGRSLIPHKQQVIGSCSYDCLRAWLRQECFDNKGVGVYFYRSFLHFQLSRKCEMARTILQSEQPQSNSSPLRESKIRILTGAKEKLDLRAKKIDQAKWGSFRCKGIRPFLVSLFKKMLPACFFPQNV